MCQVWRFQLTIPAIIISRRKKKRQFCPCLFRLFRNIDTFARVCFNGTRTWPFARSLFVSHQETKQFRRFLLWPCVFCFELAKHRPINGAGVCFVFPLCFDCYPGTKIPLVTLRVIPKRVFTERYWYSLYVLFDRKINAPLQMTISSRT